LLNNPQSYPEAVQVLARMDSALEALEDSGLIVGRNSRSVVRYTNEGAA
jgi:hypothetical protein